MKKKEKLQAIELLKLLKRVYLGGIIDECVLEADKGSCMIRAVDMTNSLFVQSCGDVDFGVESEIGLGDLGLLCRYLDMAKEEKIQLILKRDRRMILKRKKHGQLDYLLSEAEVIPTSIEEKNAVKKLKKQAVSEVEITESFRADYLSFMALTKLKAVTIEADEKGKVIIQGGAEREHKFKLSVGKLDKHGEEIGTVIYAEHLSAVLEVLDISENSCPVFKMGGSGQPLIIQQGNKNVWALLPIEETE